MRNGNLFQKLFWYSVIRIVLIYFDKNCSGDREKLLKLQAEGREFTKSLRSLEHFIWTVCLFVYFAIIQSTFRLFKGQQYLNNM